ncbi:hypothetical protein BH11BAC4_BH11BAC4_16590 [soil metagenome]
MIRNLLAAIVFSIPFSSAFAQFGLYASAAYIKTSGTNSFYNNTAPGLGQDIGAISFQGVNLGVFEQNSGNLKLIGSEIKTFKGVSDNVCSGTLNYTVYVSGSRPASPIFTAINLDFYSDCFSPTCSSFFGSYNLAAGGGCCSDRDQKWQRPGFGSPANVDLTNNLPAIYTLEIYYSYTGQDGGSGCVTTKYDNNNNNPTNYTADFTITIPIPVSFGEVRIANNSAYNNISWNTYSESNTNIFQVERSADGISFYNVGQVVAAGFSASLRNYAFRDTKPISGINYYRVKMLEADGRFQYSTVVKTTNKITGKWSFSVNQGKEQIRLAGIENGDEINIFNPAGIRVFGGRSNTNTLIVSTRNITSGVYFIKITGNKGSAVQQIIVNH